MVYDFLSHCPCRVFTEMPDCVAEQRKYDIFLVCGGTHPEKIAEKYTMLKDEAVG